MSRIPNTSCVVCGVDVYQRPGQAALGYKAHCSRACANKSLVKDRPCPVCGQQIVVCTNKTCSRTCANKLRTGIQYRVGQPKNKKKLRDEQKTAIMHRDGEQCNRCGYSEHIKILVVHHRKGRKIAEADSLDNLEVLCPNCHAIEHYG